MKICYNGKLSIRNFCCDDAGYVKIDAVEPLPLTKTASKEDKKRAATLIREEIFRERVVPTGIENLLSAMESEDTSNGELIDEHTSIQPPLKRLPLCEFMYRSLMSAKRSDPVKYRAVVAEFKKKVDIKHWKHSAIANKHLNKILSHVNPKTGLPTSYEETPEGLLHYIYNAIKHLTDHDFEQGALQFHDYEIDHIIFGTFPGVLEALQEAMFANGCLFKLD